MLTLLLGWLFGLVQGVRHAFEPDHIAAVSTFVAEQRTARASARFAVAWGLGHMLVLVVVGGALVVLRTHMPVSIEDTFELVVAVMLVLLGVRGLRLAWGRPKEPAAPHAHGHGHHGTDGRGSRARGWSLAPRGLVVGCIHGLAGTGALTALVLAKIASPLTALVFMALYGLGATMGMAGLAGLAGVPLARLARNPRGIPLLMGGAGVFSLGLGVVWGLPVALRLAMP